MEKIDEIWDARGYRQDGEMVMTERGSTFIFRFGRDELSFLIAAE